MHLNSVPPESFTTIASMSSHVISSKPYFKPVKEDVVARRIKTIFKKSGLVELFSRSKGKTVNVVSLGCGTSCELPVINRYAEKFGFTYRYFGLDISSEVFSEKKGQIVPNSNTFHIVDASDFSCIKEEIPILGEENSVDAILVLQPDIEDEPYPFWKMFLEVIPRLVKPDGLVVSSFFLHPEVIKFYEFTKAEPMSSIFKSVVCGTTEPIEEYTFASQHQWFATATVRGNVDSKALPPPLLDLFKRIIAAPAGSCYDLTELAALKEDWVTNAVKNARERNLKIREHTKAESCICRPPKQMFIYENCDWYKKLYK